MRLLTCWPNPERKQIVDRATHKAKQMRRMKIILAATAVALLFFTLWFAFVLGKASQRSPRLEIYTADTGAKLCINGVAYEVGAAYIGSPWQGVYRPVERAQEPLVGADGKEVIREVLPARCQTNHE
jgi:hypothetical protein